MPTDFDEEFLPPQVEELSGPDLDEEVAVAKAAAAFRNSPVYAKVLGLMGEQVYAAFKATPARDDEGLRYIHALSKTVEDFDAILVDTIETGRLAAEQIQQRQDDYRTETA